ncbi:MAG: hypothetical protein AAB605_02270 [Patescibacteria group bacterium]
MSSPEDPGGPSNPDERERKRHEDRLNQVLNKINRGQPLDADDNIALTSELTPDDFVREQVVHAVITSKNKEAARFLLKNFEGDFPDDVEELERIAR